MNEGFIDQTPNTPNSQLPSDVVGPTWRLYWIHELILKHFHGGPISVWANGLYSPKWFLWGLGLWLSEDQYQFLVQDKFPPTWTRSNWIILVHNTRLRPWYIHLKQVMISSVNFILGISFGHLIFSYLELKMIKFK